MHEPEEQDPEHDEHEEPEPDLEEELDEEAEQEPHQEQEGEGGEESPGSKRASRAPRRGTIVSEVLITPVKRQRRK